MDVMQLRRSLLMKPTSRIPAEYREVEYIQSDGTAYINTELIPFDDIGFDITFYTMNAITSGNFGCVFGGRTSSDSNELQLTTYSTNASAYRGIFRYVRSYPVINAGISLRVKQTASFRHGTYTRPDGTTSQAGNYSYNNPTNPIYLFGLRSRSSFAQAGSGCRIYDMVFYDTNDKVIRHYIPCYRISDNEPGMYEIINKRFYTNANSSGQLSIPT